MEGLGGKDLMRNRKEERGGATPPSSSLGLFGAGGANRGELRDHVPLPLKERGVDRQLTRKGNIARLEVRDKNEEESSEVASVIWRQMNPV